MTNNQTPNNQLVTIPGYGEVPLSSIQWSGSNMSQSNNPWNSTNQFEWGINAPTLKMGMSGLQTIGNLWGGYQANKIAKDHLDFTKKVTNTNLDNQTKSYNTELERRAQLRGSLEDRSASDVQQYIDKNRLTR